MLTIMNYVYIYIYMYTHTCIYIYILYRERETSPPSGPAIPSGTKSIRTLGGDRQHNGAVLLGEAV